MRTRPTMTALGLVSSLGLALAGSGTAAAQATPDDPRVFDQIDTNGDGVIDMDEVRAGSERWFVAYDQDRDGVLTRDEMAGYGEGTTRLVLSDMDADGDGTISRDEFLTAQRSDYEERAGAGDVTSRDYTELVSERDDRLVPVDLDADDMVSEEEAAADWERSFDAIDRNRDDAIGEEEWFGDAEGGPTFAELDADQDGVVTRREYMTYGQQSYDLVRERSGSEQVTTRDYAESTRWRDEALVPDPDRDGDGIITMEEFEADAERAFASFDSDRDGILTSPEYDPSQAAIRDMTDTFAASGDADVIIEQQDYLGFREQEFEEADLDDDGVVSVWEYRSYRRN